MSASCRQGMLTLWCLKGGIEIVGYTFNVLVGGVRDEEGKGGGVLKADRHGTRMHGCVLSKVETQGLQEPVCVTICLATTNKCEGQG